MEYDIFCEGELIATFKNNLDRDLCLDTLANAYPDCTFETV